MDAKNIGIEKAIRLLKKADSFVLLAYSDSEIKAAVKGDYELIVDKLWNPKLNCKKNRKDALH